MREADVVQVAMRVIWRHMRPSSSRRKGRRPQRRWTRRSPMWCTYHQFAVEAIVPLNSEGRQGVGVARRLCFSSESTTAGRQDWKRDVSYGSWLCKNALAEA